MPGDTGQGRQLQPRLLPGGGGSVAALQAAGDLVANQAADVL